MSGSHSLDSLYNITIKNPQYRASDFGRLSNFPYAKDITEGNSNLAIFSYGSVKHLLALVDGTLPAITSKELISRLQHLSNVLEISCLRSNLLEFCSESWTEARNYNSRVISEVETGVKDWLNLDRAIDSTCWQFAKQLASADFNFSDTDTNTDADAYGDTDSDSDSLSNLIRCSSWNTFRKKGCQFEFLNPGRDCKFLHCCSTCESNGRGLLCHKSIHC